MRRPRPLRSIQKPLQTYVTQEERNAIIERAKRYNLSVSAFIRAACLGRPLGIPVAAIHAARAARIAQERTNR